MTSSPSSRTPSGWHTPDTNHQRTPGWRTPLDHFLPLQEPEILFSRSHLPGLLLRQATQDGHGTPHHERPEVLDMPAMRYMRLIGNNNPRYEWEQYRKSEEELKGMRKPVREYYERINNLIDHYMYVDKLLDSTLPRELLQTYHDLEPVQEDLASRKNGNAVYGHGASYGSTDSLIEALYVPPPPPPQRKRPAHIYNTRKVIDEETPLLHGDGGGGDDDDEEKARIVTIAIWINFAANTVLLIAKLMVAVLTSSLSVLASLVDGVLDFLSTVIVATTTRLVEHKDSYAYPIGRSRLEPLGVLVFGVIMMTSFAQVAIEAVQRLYSPVHNLVNLTPVAIAIMLSTVVIKGACWLWCRLIKNSSVQALAADAFTDVIFNFFSMLFPLVGSLTDNWWMDPLGGLLLSIYVIFAWGHISKGHIKNLTGAAATADQRNVLLYLTMRFARSIKQITSVQAYHAGDNLNVEVDIVLDDGLELKDSHDLGESLQYVLESLPIVDRAFVHLDYDSRNPPGHLR